MKKAVSFRRWSIALLCLTLCGGLLHAGPSVEPEPVTPREYRRAPDQTFLTFPEWFLVYSPEEYADYLERHTPTGFPFLGHLGQFWRSYGSVFRETKASGYPFNQEYHLMILVIGASTTLEYTCRSLYESSIGRLTSLPLGHDLTEEDRYAARVARDYVDFIRVHPWYEFNFWEKLGNLWSQNSLLGRHPVRKIERHVALSVEYGAKGIYGLLLKTLTHSAYAVPSPVTAILLDNLPEPVASELPDLKLIHRYPDHSVLVTVPRYQAFTANASTLAKDGLNFREIAGNQGLILLSLLAPGNWNPGCHDFRILFRQKILTHPDRQRIALVVKVHDLAKLLRQLHSQGISAEHIYDY